MIWAFEILNDQSLGYFLTIELSYISNFEQYFSSSEISYVKIINQALIHFSFSRHTHAILEYILSIELLFSDLSVTK